MESDPQIQFWARMLDEAFAPACEAEGIANDAVYLDNMSKTFSDKAWFVKYLPDDVRLVVDFGGGTGDFLEYIRGMLAKKGAEPEFAVIDNNPSFLSRARSKGFRGYESMEQYAAEGHAAAGRSLLIMNSVIHEVYSYAESPADVSSFWRAVGECGFDMVAIRDMSLNWSDYKDVPADAVVWVYENVFRNPNLRVKGVPLPRILGSFEDEWGALCDVRLRTVNVKNLIHFLIKYRYVENWEREVRENYLPVTQNRLQGILEGMGYRLEHKESSRLDWYRKTWTKDFKLNIPDDGGYRRRFAGWLAGLNTHIKWLAAR